MTLTDDAEAEIGEGKIFKIGKYLIEVRHPCAPLCILLVVLESLFCLGGEFERISNNVIRIRFYDNCYITFELQDDYPSSHPSISVTLELMTRSQNEVFKEVRPNS